MIQIRSLCLVGALAISAFVASAQQAAPDLILFNGKIFTSDSAHPYVQALAIRGERIVATGDSAKIRALAGPQTKQIDLAGHTVIPGINDAHYHLAVTPANEFYLRFKSPDPTLAEVGETIVAALPQTHEGTIIYGLIGPAAYPDLQLNRDFLDELVHDRPIILHTVSGHAVVLNSAALTKFGIPDGKTDPLGGRYERNSDGRLTGVLREYAALDLERKLTDLASESDAVKELREKLSGFAKLGITSIQDMSNAIAPEHCLALLDKVPSPIRVRVIRMPGSTPNGRDTREGLEVLHHRSGLVTVDGTKWMLDGTPLEGTFATRQAQAALFAAVRQAQTSGTVAAALDDAFATLALTFPREQIPAMLEESLRDSDQLMVHVSGFLSASAMIDAMKSSGGKSTWASKRVRFEHGDGLFPDLLPRVKELGIIVVQNPSHFAHNMKLARAQPLKSFLVAGIPLALGSDGGGRINPYVDIMFASTHPDRPSEAITREQAVIAYTLTSAYAEFTEKDKGSLEPGKLADLAVLSQDIFSVPTAELPKTQSVLTLVGGKTVYDVGVVH
ncbi:MAG: amidohydrolase family protein [Candidatus Sulfotelmatobacter sp.]